MREGLRSVLRLSNMTIVLGCHRTRAWKSCPETMCCMRKSMSQRCSGSFRPLIFVMNSPLTKRHFSPVTGCTRTSGCTVSTGSLRTRLPVRRAWLIILAEEWVTRRVSSQERSVGERRLLELVPVSNGDEVRGAGELDKTYLYAISVAAKTVSPPTSGPSRSPSMT